MTVDERQAKVFNNNCHFWHNVEFHLGTLNFSNSYINFKRSLKGFITARGDLQFIKIITVKTVHK